MRYCPNPDCPSPKNERTTDCCQTCGSSLTLHQRFDLMLRLGRGSYGAAFLAIDYTQAMPTHCVVKQFCPKNTEPEKHCKALFRFQQEAKLLQRLNHPQLPHFIDYFEEDQQLYLVQEYIHGVPLTRAVKKLGALPEADVKQMLINILPVLGYMHEQQVIHRDINPNNVLYRTKDSQLVLIDFGLAADWSSQEVTNLQNSNSRFIGTPGYASPENGTQPVAASDIFSLGATCLYLLTGKSAINLQRDADTGDVAWESSMQVSEGFRHILNRMLQLQVYQRYQSPLNVLQDLSLVLK